MTARNSLDVPVRGGVEQRERRGPAHVVAAAADVVAPSVQRVQRLLALARGAAATTSTTDIGRDSRHVSFPVYPGFPDSPVSRILLSVFFPPGRSFFFSFLFSAPPRLKFQFPLCLAPIANWG